MSRSCTLRALSAFGAAVALAAFVACGGVKPEAQQFPNHPNADMVVLVTFGGKKAPAFDPNSPDPRVKKAYRQLWELVGHPVNFHFDEALVPKWTSDFDTLFAECIERVTEDLVEVKTREPAVFERTAKKIERIEVFYDSTAADRWDSKLDGTKVVLKLQPDTTLIPRGAIAHAATLGDRAALDAKWAKTSPEDVAPADLQDYFNWVRWTSPDSRAADPGGDGAKIVDNPHAEVVLSVARLVEIARAKHAPDDTQAQLARWMATDAMRIFTDAYRRAPSAAASAPASSRFKRAEAAWIAWFKANERSLPDDQRIRLHEDLFVREGDHTVTSAWPGLDVFALGISMFDAWAKDGHEVHESTQNAQQALYNVYVCPLTIESDGDTHSGPVYCEKQFYRWVMDRPDTKQRFSQYLLSKHDGALTRAVFANFLHDNAALDFLSTLESDDAQWSVAFRTLVDAHLSVHPEPFLDEVKRLWPRSPGKHAALFYGLVQLDSFADERFFKWADVPSMLGGPIDAATYGAALDVGPAALRTSGRPLAALGKGWSRVDVVTPRIERAPDDTLRTAVRSLHDGLCREKNQADLTRLKAFVERRAQAHPSEASDLRRAIDSC